jgi:hypothetical protein
MNKKTFLLLGLAGVCVATTYPVPVQGAGVVTSRKAPHIADNWAAQGICPGVCTPHGETWNGHWGGTGGGIISMERGVTIRSNNTSFTCACEAPEKKPVLKLPSNIKRVGPQVPTK